MYVHKSEEKENNWMKYCENIYTRSKPYPGFTYTNVEVKVGEETVLNLPATPSTPSP